MWEKSKGKGAESDVHLVWKSKSVQEIQRVNGKELFVFMFLYKAVETVLHNTWSWLSYSFVNISNYKLWNIIYTFFAI